MESEKKNKLCAPNLFISSHYDDISKNKVISLDEGQIKLLNFDSRFQIVCTDELFIIRPRT